MISHAQNLSCTNHHEPVTNAEAISTDAAREAFNMIKQVVLEFECILCGRNDAVTHRAFSRSSKCPKKRGIRDC